MTCHLAIVTGGSVIVQNLATLSSSRSCPPLFQRALSYICTLYRDLSQAKGVQSKLPARSLCALSAEQIEKKIRDVEEKV